MMVDDLPARLTKIGSVDRPATEEDIADMQENLAAVSQDPNLTIVSTHVYTFPVGEDRGPNLGGDVFDMDTDKIDEAFRKLQTGEFQGV